MHQQVLPRAQRKLPVRWLVKRPQRQSAQPRSGVSEAGVWAGQPLSTEISFQGPTSLCRGEGNTTEGAIAMPSEALAVSQTLSMPRSFTRGNREILAVSRSEGRLEREVQGQPRTTSMHAAGKSDEGVVPTNRRRQPPRTGREGLKPEGSRFMLGSGTLCPIPAMAQKDASVRSTPSPEVGAVCGNAARTDLSGGRSARAVPTTPNL